MTKTLKDHKGNEKMSTQDIVRTHVNAHHGEEGNWQAVYVELHNLLEKPQFRIMRAGNTLFLFHNNGNNTAMVFMFNGDRVGKLVGNMKEFFAAMKKAGFKQLYTNTKRHAIIHLVEKTGYPSVTYRSENSDPKGNYMYYMSLDL